MTYCPWQLMVSLVGFLMSGHLKLANLFLIQLFHHSSAANCRWTESEWEFSISDSGFQCTITRDSNRKMPSALNLGFYRQRHIWEVSWSHRRANVLKKMKFGKNVIYYVNLLANIQQTHGKHLRNHKSWLELLFVTIDKLFLPSPLQWSLFADFKLTQTNNRLVSVTRVLLTGVWIMSWSKL